MKKNNGNLSIIFLIVSIIVLIIAAVFWMFTNNYSEEKNNQISKSSVINNLNADENNTFNDNFYNSNIYNENDINSWNSKYIDESNNTVLIYRIGENTFHVDINNINKSKISTASYIVEVSSNNKIEYIDTSFGDNDNFTITRDSNEIELICDSEDIDSVLNLANGTYYKEDFEKNGWDGRYKNGDNTIILAETDSDTLVITINNYFIRYADECNDKEINYEDSFFDDLEEIKIEKTTNGIKVTSSSTDSDNDILNEISGKEFKFID
jgi:hypothetical protein